MRNGDGCTEMGRSKPRERLVCKVNKNDGGALDLVPRSRSGLQTLAQADVGGVSLRGAGLVNGETLAGSWIF